MDLFNPILHYVQLEGSFSQASQAIEQVPYSSILVVGFTTEKLAKV